MNNFQIKKLVEHNLKIYEEFINYRTKLNIIILNKPTYENNKYYFSIQFNDDIFCILSIYHCKNNIKIEIIGRDNNNVFRVLDCFDNTYSIIGYLISNYNIANNFEKINVFIKDNTHENKNIDKNILNENKIIFEKTNFFKDENILNENENIFEKINVSIDENILNENENVFEKTNFFDENIFNKNENILNENEIVFEKTNFFNDENILNKNENILNENENKNENIFNKNENIFENINVSIDENILNENQNIF